MFLFFSYRVPYWSFAYCLVIVSLCSCRFVYWVVAIVIRAGRPVPWHWHHVIQRKKITAPKKEMICSQAVCRWANQTHPGCSTNCKPPTIGGNSTNDTHLTYSFFLFFKNLLSSFRNTPDVVTEWVERIPPIRKVGSSSQVMISKIDTYRFLAWCLAILG